MPWQEDTWFMMCIPLILGSRYGQNEALAFMEAKANAFHGLMRWEDMWWVSFAVVMGPVHGFYQGSCGLILR